MSEESKDSPREIGGWLLIVALGLIIAPVRIAYGLWSIYWPLFNNGTWEALTTKGSNLYHAAWKPLIIAEILGNGLAIVLTLVALIYFLQKSRNTPKMMVIVLAWGLLFSCADYIATIMMAEGDAQPHSDDTKELIRSFIAACIWIPYFRVSKRVKETFIA